MQDVFGGAGPLTNLYRELVGLPVATAAELAERLGLDPGTTTALLTQLVDQGLATTVGDGWEALPPEVAAAELQAEHRRRITQIQAGARALEQTYHAARRNAPDVPGMELLRDSERIHEEWFRMQRDTIGEIRCLERPPYLTAQEMDRADLLRQIALQAERIAAGVSYRTIYDRTVLDDDIYSRLVVDNIALGERARTLAEVPIKLVISDNRRALLLLDAAQPRYEGGVLVVHESSLLDAFIATFESLWRLAVPVSDVEGKQQPLEQLDRDILSLMAVGATDDLIARRLDVSRRTVVRHTAALLERLGATNRFQAGLQAARRGWL